jgi:hypothetical protein
MLARRRVKYNVVYAPVVALGVQLPWNNQFCFVRHMLRRLVLDELRGKPSSVDFSVRWGQY